MDLRSATAHIDEAITALPPGDASFAVLRMGLDCFRAVNRSFGSVAGNELLLLVEERLRSAVREYETVVRLPGDEFAIFLHSVTTVIRAGAAADRLNHLVHEPYTVQGQSVAVTACVGVALAPEDGLKAEILLRRAGAALRCAKAAGPGVVQIFESAMEEARPSGFSIMAAQWHESQLAHVS